MTETASAEPRFFVHAPAKPLSDFVAMFWYWEGYEVSHAQERCLPTATTEVVINLGSERDWASVMVGSQSKSFLIDRREQDRLLGIHFHPGGAFPFFGCPAGELQNLELPLETLWGRKFEALKDQLLEGKNVQAQFKILEDWLLKQAHTQLVRHPAVRFALEEFRIDPVLSRSVTEIVDDFGISQRRFIEVFRNEVGLTPKLFQRIMRFQEILQLLEKQTEVDWTETALSCGYFDQAHFNHDFREFSGLNPTEYLTRRTGRRNHVREG